MTKGHREAAIRRQIPQSFFFLYIHGPYNLLHFGTMNIKRKKKNAVCSTTGVCVAQ